MYVVLRQGTIFTSVVLASHISSLIACCICHPLLLFYTFPAGYLEMILHVMGLGHPVITVEFRGVAMRLGKVYTADEVADSVAGILDKLNVKEACVVGHSYGA
jgi:pimeloyl-ACP methyl ester carboxylesterase